MREPVLIRISSSTVRALAALALAVAPWHLTADGSVKTSAAHAGNGNGNGGNGNGNGGGSGNGGNGNGNGGNNGNAGGNGNGNGDGDGNNGTGNGQGNSSVGGLGSSDQGTHVNLATGDKVEVVGDKITVLHPNGMKEEVENGRFEMRDALGRTIVERKATQDDIMRLQSL
ncbi:MAG: hypothetical protein AB1440_22345 [Pseudomonadota bacterium]